MSKISPVPLSIREQPDLVQFLEEIRQRTNSAATITDLNQTIAGPSIAEVQTISDKVDEILAALRPNVLET